MIYPILQWSYRGPCACAPGSCGSWARRGRSLWAASCNWIWTVRSNPSARRWPKDPDRNPAEWQSIWPSGGRRCRGAGIAATSTSETLWRRGIRWWAATGAWPPPGRPLEGRWRSPRTCCCSDGWWSWPIRGIAGSPSASEFSIINNIDITETSSIRSMTHHTHTHTNTQHMARFDPARYRHDHRKCNELVDSRLTCTEYAATRFGKEKEGRFRENRCRVPFD